MLYFDVCPADVLICILKFFSEEPYSSLWNFAVHSEDVVTVLQLESDLCTVARKLFTSMTALDFGYDDAREFMANLNASRIQRLHVNAEQFTRLNHDQFCSLQELKLDGLKDENGLERVLNACSSSLSKLHIQEDWIRDKALASIARHCKSLKMFGVSRNNYHLNFDSVWSTVGSTLIELSLNGFRGDFGLIAQECKGIRKLSFRSLDEIMLNSQDSLEQFLGALEQLHVLDLGTIDSERITAEQVDALLRNCSSDIHVHLDLFLERDEDFAGYVTKIGTKLRELKLDYRGNINPSLPNDLISKLAKIEVLRIGLDSEEKHGEEPLALEDPSLIDKIFKRKSSGEVESVSMPDLEVLHLGHVRNLNIWHSLALIVSAVRRLSCSFYSNFEEGTDVPSVISSEFMNFLKSNPQLNYIDVDYTNCHNSEFGKKEAIDFITSFKDCKNLNEVTICYGGENERERKSTEISDACVFLRIKAMTLVVNGVRYLPKW